ncbi:MAG: hypothetical protein OXC30_03420 [Alphaproteobacteria bacterium]|nr:hypothetical protein [Alphaproteobacteria bacterium]
MFSFILLCISLHAYGSALISGSSPNDSVDSVPYDTPNWERLGPTRKAIGSMLFQAEQFRAIKDILLDRMAQESLPNPVSLKALINPVSLKAFINPVSLEEFTHPAVTYKAIPDPNNKNFNLNTETLLDAVSLVYTGLWLVGPHNPSLIFLKYHIHHHLLNTCCFFFNNDPKNARIAYSFWYQKLDPEN